MPNTLKDDWFICPNCGAEVPMNAKVCKSCGSDDETGWKEGALDPGAEYEEFDYDEYTRKESGKRKLSIGWWIIWAILILTAIIVPLRFI